MIVEHVIAGVCGFTIAAGLLVYSSQELIIGHFERREREQKRKSRERRRQQLEAQWRRADEEFELRYGRPPLHVPTEVQLSATAAVACEPGIQNAPIAPPLPPPHNPGRRRILPLYEPEL